MAKKYAPHKEVVERCYKGRGVRFRPIDGTVYIPVTDLFNLFLCNYTHVPVYQTCGSVSRIEFYRNGRSLQAISLIDLGNFLKHYGSKNAPTSEIEKLEWLQAVGKSLVNLVTTRDNSQTAVPKVSELLNIHNVSGYLDDNNVVWCNAEEIAIGLGFTQDKNGKPYVRWQRINEYLNELGLSPNLEKGSFIPENIVYRLAFIAKSSAARQFQSLIADEIIPAIRKNGAYILVHKDDTSADVMAKGIVATEEALERAQIAEQNFNRIKPKADHYDVTIEDRELYTLQQIAGEIGVNASTLRKHLAKAGLIVSAKGPLVVTDANKSLGAVVPIPHGRYRNCFKWNKEGRAVIIKLFAPNIPL